MTSHSTCNWLQAFDKEELLEFIAEILDACRGSSSDCEAERLKAIIHEWRESAIAILSDDIAEVSPTSRTKFC